MKNIAEMLRARVLDTPDKVAITDLDEHVTWAQLYAQAYALSLKLEAHGVGRADVVAVYLPHSLGQAVAMFAVAMRDAVWTLINPLLAGEQVKHQINDASARLMVGSTELVSPLAGYFEERGLAVEMVTARGLPEAAADPATCITSNIPADVSNYIYTSGSTGLPKGIVVPHRTVLDGARIVSGYLDITSDDVILSILPFSFDMGLNQLMSCVHTGARLVIHRFLLPKDLIDTVAREQVTGIATVPPVWPKLFRRNTVDPESVSSLRYVTCGGGFYPPELLRDIHAFFPTADIFVMYGLTEAFRSTYLDPSEVFTRDGCIGKPVPEVEVMVLDAHGKPCAPGEKGELVHRGAFVTYGYLNNPELTAEKFVPLQRDGRDCLPETVVRSGDLASMDEDGYLYFHGRLDFQIKSNGFRLSPDEVAQAVLSMPGIAQAVAFGLPDPDLGHSVNLAYETTSGEEVSARDIKRHAKGLLASYALPQHFYFYESLPVNANGKVDMGAIKRAAVEQQAGDGR